MSFTLSPEQDAAVINFKRWYDDLPEHAYSHTSMRIDPVSMEMVETPVYSRGLDEAPYFLLEGYAGTGKSTILPKLVEATGVQPHEIVFCSPTGKAAKVMTKKMAADGMDSKASTIHRAIYLPQRQEAFRIEADLFGARNQYEAAVKNGDTVVAHKLLQEIKKLEINLERAYDENAPKFQLNVNSSIENRKLIVVDECSMVDELMADDLRSFGVPILAIGDPGQLPPISAGPGFCTRKADAALTQIHRQALDNPIIWASKLIREGEQVPMGSHGSGQLIVVDRDDDEATYDLDRDAQIIVGRHEKRWQITRKLRKMCGVYGEGPAEGELMIINKNSRLYPDLVNGTMAMMTKDVGQLRNGAVTFTAEVRDEDGKDYTLRCLQATLEEHYMGKNRYTAQKRDVFRARNDERCHELDFGYAITCHKSQGSQWNECVVHDESSVFRNDAAKWLYTAVTRAAEKLTLVV